jgi:hypothetical protein
MDKRNVFVETLIRKLKSGDARSIHLDALPGRYARLDLYDLVNIETSLHHEFLKKLLSGKPFSFAIQIGQDTWKSKPAEEQQHIWKIIKRLNHLYYQEQDEFAEMGTLSFGFGFPLLIFRDPLNPSRILKAPLVIWYLKIEKDSRFSNTWTLSRTDQHPVLFNEVLKAHVESSAGIRWNTPAEWDDENPIDETALKALIKDTLASFNIQPNEDELFVKVMPCTNKQAIDRLTQQQPWIRWSGVFGLYKTQKQSIIQDLLELSQLPYHVESNLPSDRLTQDTITPVPLDPSQETVLHHLNEFGKIIIQGPPGTGKSQSISAVITSALLENKKILVVCEKRTALEVIKNNLEKLGLGELLVLIEDVYADRNQVVQRMREVIDNAREEVPYFKNFAFDFSKQKMLENRANLNQRVDALYKRIFGDDTWLELAEKHRSIAEQQGLPFLSKDIAVSDYSFCYEEWLQISNAIRKDSQLMTEMSSVIHTSEALPYEFWKSLNEDKWSYAFQEILETLRDLHRILESNHSLFGSAFFDISNTAILISKVAGLLSGKHKALNEARSKAIASYRKLYSLLEDVRWPEHQLTPPGVEDNMMHWPTPVDMLLKKAEIIAPQYNRVNLIRQWTEWLVSKPAALQPVFRQLCFLPAEKRSHVFDEWYFRQFLQQYAQANRLAEDGEYFLNEFLDHEKIIHPLIAEKTLFIWRSAAKKLLHSQDTAEKRMLYNLRKNKQFSSRNTLRSILKKDFEFFSTVFPVVMLNPVTASAILPLRKDLFDVIVLDEASQLRVEDTYAALYRGERHVISGDEHQMPPSSWFNSEVLLWEDQEDGDEAVDQFLAGSASLLEFAADAGYQQTYLDFHYRSKHPDLIAFSNAGFYGSRLIPMPPRQEYQAMHFHAINGVYSGGMNPEEARAIVDFVYQLAAKQSDKLPGIGIGTLNIYQRDLIQDLLWEAAFADEERKRLMEKLVNAGLFVKNLENIQGDERDIIIIGTTFGPDEKGNFRQNFGPLNRQNGYKLLNVLITRAKTDMYVFTSIPETHYLYFEEELRTAGNTGKSLLYAYLSYVRAVAEKDVERRNYILNFLRENNGNGKTASSVRKNLHLPAFISEAMKRQLGVEINEQKQLGGFELEATIEKNDRTIYLQMERKASHRDVHYRELIYRPAILKPFNITTKRIWAYQWWNDPTSCLENF